MGTEALRLLVVMPAYNEEASVAAVVREVRAALPDAGVLVIDDGSRDHTAVRAEQAGARVLRLPYNLGVGGALRAGYRWAIANGFNAVVQVDADGQHDPRGVVNLVAKLDRADLVIGARFAGTGEYSARGPRRWAMHLLAWMLSGITRSELTDATSGFKLAGPRALRVFAENFPAEYLGDTIEALVIAARSHLRIVQVPVAMRPRQGGEPSHNPLKSAVYLMRAMVALVLATLRPRTRAEQESA